MRQRRSSRWGAVFSTIVAAAILVSCGCGSTGTAQLEHIKQDGVLTVGNDTTYAPFEFMDSTNAPTGFDVDLISAVAANLGLKAQIVTTAWDGIIPALQAQKFEAVISAMTITPDREKEVLFSTPYYRSEMGIVFDKTLHTISGPEDLAGLRVGVQIGTTGETSARLISGRHGRQVIPGYSTRHDRSGSGTHRCRCQRLPGLRVLCPGLCRPVRRACPHHQPD